MKVKLLIVALAACVLTVGAQPQPVRWEYKMIHRMSMDDLNQMGNDGWQLAAATSDGGFTNYYLMRQK